MSFKKIIIFLLGITLAGCPDTHNHHINTENNIALGRYYSSKRIPPHNQKYIQIAKYRAVLDMKNNYENDHLNDIEQHNNPDDKYRAMYLKMARDNIKERDQDEDHFIEIYIDEIGLEPHLERFYEEENKKNDNQMNSSISIDNNTNSQNLDDKSDNNTLDTEEDILGWYYSPEKEPIIKSEKQSTKDN